MTTAALAHRFTIDECVSVYEKAEAMIRGSYAQLDAAEQLLNDTFTLGGYGSISVESRRSSIKDVLLSVQHDVWYRLIERLEVRRMMSIGRWNELQEQIRKHELPPITRESVTQLVRGFEVALPDMLEEAVEEVFAWLRPCRSEYKTNSELEVPEKVVLEHVVEVWGKYCSSWRIHYRRDAELTALENVFSALDGQGQITKTHYSAISNVIRDKCFDGTGQTPYFSFRVFRNGNMHLKFLRADLLARFNQIAGGRRLRPAPATSHATEGTSS